MVWWKQETISLLVLGKEETPLDGEAEDKRHAEGNRGKERREQRGSFLDIELEFSCPYKACSLLPG